MKKLVFTLLLSISSIHIWAQEAQDNEQSTQKTITSMPGTENDEHKDHSIQLAAMPVKPPNYGSLVIDWGFNFLRDCPSEMKSKDWGARFASVGLCYNIRLGHSHFTISPGIGLRFEGYRLKEGTTLESRKTTVFKTDSSNSKNTLSALDIRYVDLVMEAKFNANSKYPKESFFVALGGKAGWPWKACATVRYKEYDETKEHNNWETFHLNKIHYGIHARLGWGRFGLCYTHMLSRLFNGEGPSTTQPCSLGLSIDLF